MKNLYEVMGNFLENLSSGQQGILTNMLSPQQLADFADLIGMYEEWKQRGRLNASVSISDWLAMCHGYAKESGFWATYEHHRDAFALTADQLLSKLMLVVSELSEAVELVRLPDFNPRAVMGLGHNGGLASYETLLALHAEEVAAGVFQPRLPKPEGFGTELADAVIRVFDLCGALGIDLEARIAEKHRYNQTRGHRHGNKRA